MTWLPRSPGSTLVLWLNQETVHRLHLAVLSTMRPALDPTSHRVPRTKPTCLLRSWRPHRQRPFALVLHLHQHESSRNLHLQYLAKNQSTQRCQSLITPRSDHPPVLEPHMILRRSRVRSTPRCGAFRANPYLLGHMRCDQSCAGNGGGYSVDKGWLGISLFCGETCTLRREMIKFEQSIGIGNH
jgi:hypothetical protein